MMGSHNDAHGDSYGNSSQDSTLMMREVSFLTFDLGTVASLTPQKPALSGSDAHSTALHARVFSVFVPRYFKK